MNTAEKAIEEAQNNPPYKAVEISDFLEMDLPERELIMSPWLPVQGLAMIYAPRGVGKTHIALGIGYAVSSGSEFLRWGADRPRGVLYLDGEMPASVLQERLAQISDSSLVKTSAPFRILTPDLQEFSTPDLSTFEGQAAVDQLLEGIDLIIVDNISTLCRNGKENEAEGWLPIQAWALRMRSQGRSVLFIHHAGKSGNQRGTSKREDVLDTVVSLRRPIGYDPKDGAVFEVHFEKTRGFCGEDAEPFEAKLIAPPDSKQSWIVTTLEQSNLEKVAALMNDGYTQKDISSELELSKGYVSKLVRQAREAGMLVAA